VVNPPQADRLPCSSTKLNILKLPQINIFNILRMASFGLKIFIYKKDNLAIVPIWHI